MLTKRYIYEANEHSSVLPTLKQITPSDRNNIQDCGVGDRSDVGKKPVDGQNRIWGNLDKQSKGMTGTIDTQGKDKSVMFTDHKNSRGQGNTGTFTPSKYKSMLSESSTGAQTGTLAGKNKISAAANNNSNQKYKQGADTANCSCEKHISEALSLGGALAIAAMYVFNENCTKS